MVFLADLLLRAIFEDRKKSAIIGELNKNLESANSKLKALDAMKTEFVSLASHELLTPVSAIEGYLSMILDEKMVKITDKKALEYLGNVSKSSHRLARLITDLLNVSRIEEGRMMVERSRANISEIIKQVVSEIEVKAKKSNIKIKFQKKDDGCCEIYADIDKVKEVLVNLCSNAIKYNKPEGVVEISFQTMTVEQIVSLGGHSGRQDLEIEKEDGAIVNAVSDVSRQLVGEKQLVISVKDSGIGIKKDEVKNLFKKFSRIGDWSVQEVQGTGLGLYISKALTEMNRGRMWVDSEGEGKGSTFHFSIPLLIDKDKVIEIDEQVPKIKNAKPLAKGSIDE